MRHRVNGLLSTMRVGCDRLDSGPALRYEVFRRRQTRGRGIVAIDLSGGNPAMDYTEHAKTYKQFLFFTKIMIVFLVLLLAGMAYFLV
jgi:Bacterial aa3 type cytochrome c oxidase subunit IV